MKPAEKISLAMVILMIVGLLSGFFAFLVNTEFNVDNLEFHIKFLYFLFALLFVAIGILYFLTFTSGKKTKGKKTKGKK